MTNLIVGKLKRHKGYRKPEGSIVVDRRTLYGNPFEVGVDGDAAECVAKFERWLDGEEFSASYEASRHLRSIVGENLRLRRQAILKGIEYELPGKFPLMDWCVDWDGEGEPDAPCHAVVLATRVAKLERLDKVFKVETPTVEIADRDEWMRLHMNEPLPRCYCLRCKSGCPVCAEGLHSDDIDQQHYVADRSTRWQY